MATTAGPRYQSKQRPSLEEQLGEAGVAKLVAQFLSGSATHQELADRHGTSVTTIKRLLRKRDARLWVMEHKRTHKQRPSGPITKQ